ncbi:MAG: hypothetical protein ACOWWM_07810 [Desulfobacterales bacterium]
MNKFTLTGLLAWIVSGVLVGFQAISNLMEVEGEWKNIDLFDLVGESNLGWAMDWEWAVYVLDLPLFILLFAVGLILVLMGMIFWRT